MLKRAAVVSNRIMAPGRAAHGRRPPRRWPLAVGHNNLLWPYLPKVRDKVMIAALHTQLGVLIIKRLTIFRVIFFP
eukprot:COSAG01_NODE_3660_length_5817_cov_28.686604_1_plen_76_part_00